MKFTYGAWQMVPGVTATPAKNVFDYRIEHDSLWLAALDRRGGLGGERFEGLALQVRVTSPMPDVLRIRITHHEPQKTGTTTFDLDSSLRAETVRIDDEPETLRFTSGRLSVSFSKRNWSMRLEADGKLITQTPHAGLAHMRAADGNTHLLQRLMLGVGETIYGMGERFGPLVRNGQSVSIWNEDGGTTSELSYKNIPFYLSSAGYGLMVNSPGKVEFEVATERVSQIQFSVPGEELDYYVFYGSEPKVTLEKYTRLTGRPPMLPPWSFGLWLSTSFTTKYDEATVMEFVNGMAKHDIPLSVFHFDCFWMKERRWCDFEWDTDAFPDPRGMLERLKAKGLKICVWINPYISQLSPLFQECRENGYLLKRPDGSPFQIDQWQPGMGLVDFANPDAAKWYCEKLQGLLDMGVDTFKTDFGERIPVDVVYHDGSDPQLMHNYYAHAYNKCVFELLERHHGKGNAMVFARSATLGAQKFPVHWGGDSEATFEAMAEELRGGLSFCMSGPAYWSHDIGGFAGKADPAVYKRWAAFGLLSSHSRLHGSESYRVPWLFDEESVDVVRTFTRLKNRLSPYLLSAAHDAHEHGWPLMRSMIVEFPNDPAVAYLDRQYMLGDSLLVAPIFNHENVARFYLPQGVWTDIMTGEPCEGGRWVTRKVDFMHIPLLARPDTILPMSDQHARPGWTLAAPLTLCLFGITPQCNRTIRVCAGDGECATFTCRREGSQITLESDGRARSVRVLHAGNHHVWPDTSRPLQLRLDVNR